MYGPARQIPNCSSGLGLEPASGIIERAPERAASYLRNTAAAGHEKPGRSELLASVQSPAGPPTEMLAEADSLAFYRGFIYGLPITLCLWAIIFASIFVL